MEKSHETTILNSKRLRCDLRKCGGGGGGSQAPSTVRVNTGISRDNGYTPMIRTYRSVLLIFLTLTKHGMKFSPDVNHIINFNVADSLTLISFLNFDKK